MNSSRFPGKPILGKPMISHVYECMVKALDVDIYFAHPYSSWERGINENANGLIRQYFPKGTDFNKVTNSQIEFVMNL